MKKFTEIWKGFKELEAIGILDEVNKKIEELLDTPIIGVSIGPARNQYIQIK